MFMAFTYSKRDGTPSAVMKPEVNGKNSQREATSIRVHNKC